MLAAKQQASLARASRASVRVCKPLVALPARVATRPVCVKAAESDGGLDDFLIKFANKWEEADNKPVVAAYGVGALAALFITEWFIHLPLLDFLLGFPAQLVGVLVGPVLAVRYLVDKEDFGADVEAFAGKLSDLLPGLKKE